MNARSDRESARAVGDAQRPSLPVEETLSRAPSPVRAGAAAAQTPETEETRMPVTAIPTVPSATAAQRPSRAPLIGVTANDLFATDTGRELLRSPVSYLRALHAAGAIPVVLSPLPGSDAMDALSRLDGVVIIGGPDLGSGLYGQDPHPQTTKPDARPDRFDLAVALAADSFALPTLAICRGMQALNIARGGTLHQHVPDVYGLGICHRDESPTTDAEHPISVREGSRLAAALGSSGS